VANKEGYESSLSKLGLVRTDLAETTQTTTCLPNSSGLGTATNARGLEMSLFGLSRKLLTLQALVKRNTDAFGGADGRRRDGNAQRTKVAVNLLHDCVLKIIAISKLRNSPLPEISSEVLDQYNSPYSVQAPVDRPQAREEFLPNCLSRREREVVNRLAGGKSNKEIATALGLSVKTVETYRARIMMKLKAHSLIDIFRFAVRHKIVEL
jgi:DNA-binding CsgD family transcriptional regulator